MKLDDNTDYETIVLPDIPPGVEFVKGEHLSLEGSALRIESLDINRNLYAGSSTTTYFTLNRIYEVLLEPKSYNHIWDLFEKSIFFSISRKSKIEEIYSKKLGVYLVPSAIVNASLRLAETDNNLYSLKYTRVYRFSVNTRGLYS
ncbi:hypothetical protein N7449_005104 [Penicillium cf. viridicatum]|uniref:Uncharacterized protein n=1 Tax=Penicillium cf. viridicatum TaxID=2972119 RepID=A0A9W9MKJ5_9EURO|nr:hypothetical protein N7449_005104 [Penicillium cf. viridicatum]